MRALRLIAQTGGPAAPSAALQRAAPSAALPQAALSAALQRAALCGALLLLLLPAPANAHTRSTSYLDVWLDDAGATLRLRLTPLDDQVLQIAVSEGEWPSAAHYLADRIRLERDAQPCSPKPLTFAQLDLEPTRSAYEWGVDCPDAGPWHLQSQALFGEVAGHVSLVTVRLSATEGTVEAVFSESFRGLDVQDAGESRSLMATALGFGREGVTHILTGWDHLAFLLVLILGLWGWRQVALAVTGFTLGHSLTLVATALGLTSPHGPSVEALIALSIVLVAAENVWMAQRSRGLELPVMVVLLVGASALASTGPTGVSAAALAGLALFTASHFGLLARAERPYRLRVALAGLFGLLHGFGFAGALADMALPPDHGVLALASFNVGVELGQLVIVAILLPVLWLAARWRRLAVTVVGSAAAAGLGAFWFVSRAFG